MAVRVQARMRIDGEWIDVSIHNVSSRGLMARAGAEVGQRSYVELRRGDQIVIGRVAWSQDGYFGLRAQDRIDITGMLGTAAAADRRSDAASGWIERRTTPRDPAPPRDRDGDGSRAFGRRFQFILIGAAGASGCAAAATAVFRMLQAAILPAMSALGG